MMIGLILTQLPVKVVGSEQWIQPCTGQVAIDRTMSDAVVFILGTKQRMAIEDTAVVRLVVGNEDQGIGRGRRAFNGQ